MAMAACGDDEFGDLYADVGTVDIDALRGFGSMNWSYEDESDTIEGTPRPSAVCLTGEPFEDVATMETCYSQKQGHQSPAHAHANDCFDGMDIDMEDTVSGEGIGLHGMSTALCSPRQDVVAGNNESKNCSRSLGGGHDVETDSDDDLHIVLNPLHHDLKGVNQCSGDDSDDGENFVILTGNEAADEEPLMQVEDKAQAILVGGEKPGALGDEKGQGSSVHQGLLCIGYAGHTYHRHYRYVRGGGPSRVGATSAVSARVHSRTGDKLGSTNCQPLWGNGAPRGSSYGLEFSIPSNKTAFDLDIDSLKEKPWRLPHVDASDYFNFGFDESSWKKYCEKMVQFCLESTTQSRINVYESGRPAQSMIRAIQVGGSGCERLSSADIRGQQIRESDAIFLIDAADDNLLQSCSGDHQVDRVEGTMVSHNCSPKTKLDLRNKTGIQRASQQQGTRGIGKREGSLLEDSVAASGTRMLDSQSVASFKREGGIPEATSRLKAPKPSIPSEKIRIQEKREREGEQSCSSSLNDSSPLAHNGKVFRALQRRNLGRKENLQRNSPEKCSRKGSLNQALVENKLNQKVEVDLSHLSKKCKLGLNKVNQISHHGCPVIKKSSKARALAAVLGAYKAHVKTERAKQKMHSCNNDAIEHLDSNLLHGNYANGSCGQKYSSNQAIERFDGGNGIYVNGLTRQHLGEKSEKRPKFPSFKVESRKLKVKDGTDIVEVKNQLLSIPSESFDVKSKENLKVKKSKKRHKCKERIKPKDKVHLPGCPNVERVHVDGCERSLLNQKQGMGDMSMISIVSRNDCYYWKEVKSMSTRDSLDQDARTKKNSFHCHELEEKTERSMVHETNGHRLGAEGDAKTSKRSLQLALGRDFDGNIVGTGMDSHLVERKVVHSLKALRVVHSKKEEVRHVLLRRMRLASRDTGLLCHSVRAGNKMKSVSSNQVSTTVENTLSENKERKKKRKQLYSESKDKANAVTESALPNGGEGRKKHRSRKARKGSSGNCSQFNVTDQQRQELGASKLVSANAADLMIERKDGFPTLLDGREVDISKQKIASELGQSEIDVTKVINSELPHCSNGQSEFDMGRPLENSGFDKSRLQENDSAAEKLFVEQDDSYARSSESSEEEDKQRGRSKFERWRSHSEQVKDVSLTGGGILNGGSRISLSRKVSASKFGQCLMQTDDSAFEAKVGRDTMGGTKWKFARKQRGMWKTSFNQEAENPSNRSNEQQGVQQDLHQFMAKLEKRRERFKLPVVEEKEPSQRPVIRNSPLIDRVEVKSERPTRKRSWGGG